MRVIAAALPAAILLFTAASPAAERGPFDFYWAFFQPHTPWPIFPDLLLFAPNGEAVVTIRNHTFYDSSTASPARGAYTYDYAVNYETTIVVPGCTFVRFPLSHFSPHQMDWGYYYLEIRSDKDIWVVGEKRKQDGSIVPDPGIARPHRRFLRSLSMGANWSVIPDDRIVLVAPTPTTVTMQAWGGPYSGWDVNRTRTYTIRGPVVLEPYYVFDLAGSWTLRIDADTPLAMAVVEAGGFWRWDILGVNGYHDDQVFPSNIDTPATEFIMDRTVTFAAARMEGGGTLRVVRADGTEVFRDDLPETKGKAWGVSEGTALGDPFPTGPQKWIGTRPFAPDYPAPTPEEATIDSATFFGFDPAVSKLLVFNDEPTPVEVEVFDARDRTRTATLSVGAFTALVQRVADLGLGFADSEPFLLAVRASRPAIVAVEIDRMGGFLRPYPFRFFEVCPGGPSALVPCFEIKVPPAGRKVSGTCLAVMGDVCRGDTLAIDEAGRARRAIASVLFEYRIGSGAWGEIPSVDTKFPHPDTDHPWLIHWDVTVLPETTVWLRAVATDTEGNVRKSAEVPIEISHTAWEVRADCRGRNRSQGAARVMYSTSTEVAAATTGGESTVRVVLAAGAAPASDVLLAEVVDPSDARFRPFPADLLFVGEVRDIRLESGRRSLDGHADLYLSYADSDGDGIVDGTAVRAEDLRGYWLSDTGHWYPVETVGVDTAAKEVHLRTDHFTLFGLAVPTDVPASDGMCLAEGLGLSPRLLSSLRAWRDRFLMTRLGRLLTALYYR